MARNCTEMWEGRPPNFLLVDYYNYGSEFNGSVFEVAAEMNGVGYQRGRCCGKKMGGRRSAAAKVGMGRFGVVGLGGVVGGVVAWLML